MPTVLITGANRGIGLEFARQYAADGWRVLAACRRPAAAPELKAIKGDVQVHALDMREDAQIPALAMTLAEERIDILVNNAGVIGPREHFGKTDTQAWLDVFHVNSIAPAHMAEAFADHLERGQRKLIVNITSKMGSLADNTSGGSYIYRSSKAALNMVAKTLAVDLASRGITVVLFHPGWVRTDMGGPGALITPKESVSAMRDKISTLGSADNGKFFNFDGRPLPW
ncbi:MAG TPA: SDR family oxidoreductase [Methylomirabilota bacterium]|nr:SDR family oxidoreductase [Methylomirabilota bacterium]